MNNIDTLDRQILRVLTKDARTPYAEMAKNFGVSPGTIHVRVEKMRQSGLIEGTKAIIDERKLGYDVCCFIGIIRIGDPHSPSIGNPLGECSSSAASCCSRLFSPISTTTL